MESSQPKLPREEPVSCAWLQALGMNVVLDLEEWELCFPQQEIWAMDIHSHQVRIMNPVGDWLKYDEVFKNLGFGINQAELKSQPNHSLALWPFIDCLNPLNFSLQVSKMEVIMTNLYGCWKDSMKAFDTQ